MENRQSFFLNVKGDKIIWIIVLFLCSISIVSVYSSSSSLAYQAGKSTLFFLLQQMRFVIFGVTALYICYKIPLGWYRMLAYFGILFSIFLLAATLIVGSKINDAGRWIRILGISFQPAEIAKIAVILYLAKIMEDRPLDSFKEFFYWVIIPISLVLLLILYGSISTGLLLGGVSALILIIVGVKWKHLFKTTLIGVAVLGLIVLLNLSFGLFPRVDTAISRIKSFTTEQTIDENSTPAQIQKHLDKTYQAKMAKVAVASSHIFGKGPGNSTQRNLLPHPYSDFIYAIIIEEWGLIGGIFILVLYIFFFTRCVILAKACTTTFTSVMVMGLALLITSQAMLHISVNLGLLPVTGHTLPLVSLGGTSLVIMSGAFGMILSVSRTIEVVKKREENRDEQEHIEEKEVQE
ncbi:MAG: FtsW/RodA/SpoVE family cell cycle protein [Bacteroidales bacterium]|nr:FtsW/RodA/SpoVE family cell cycle protein [Bacteroidales bacterium]